MAQRTYRAWSVSLHLVLLLMMASALSAATPATKPSGAPPSTAPAPFKPEELEQIVAPIALYPDALLAQVFMAATYPLEVVQADRWVKQNPKLVNSSEALNKLTWDPSVKSLINVPQVLAMMSEKLDWTVKLGDAFIADQKAAMDAVQRLRGKAYANGNLKNTNEQKVSVQPTTQPSASNAQVIVVESSQPSVVYVPTYNPTVVYGGWPYPSYPPYYYYPPGYVAGAAAISFGVGVAVGAAWGHAWGNCDWHGGDVDIDIDQNVNINKDIDRDKFKAEMENRNRDNPRSRDNPGGKQKFQHDVAHRKGVSYRDSATTERFRGQGASQATAQARDSYRGRTDGGRPGGGAEVYRGGVSSGAGGGTNYRPGSSTPKVGGGPSQAPSLNNYGGAGSGSRSNSFSGANSSGASARAASNRGQSSRSSSAYSGSRGSYSGSAARSSGGASRGGGAARGGGGGGRGGGRR